MTAGNWQISAENAFIAMWILAIALLLGAFLQLWMIWRGVE
jgi:hypothetical protein